MEDEEMIIQVGDLELLVWGADKQAPAAARQFVGEWFQDRGIKDAYTAQLIVSELVTNSLLHGLPPIVVRVVRDESDGRPIIEVEDGGDGVPCVQPESDTAINGRGLLLVAALAEEWGTDPLAEGGKVTWAKCAL
ncbi:ATP-binding protein [Actinomadura bangladeshensis]|uniref:Sensor histidine kinase n=1 Tax=Actinomadura bangladeshensis TaxID=453573 RepID=A0A4R4PC68_9ACTN|nr:ATP-binding protein [Actinomadura bangladeshensis]TDC19729.1 sensor histidine kinase [Actinomadura bangladeshensis]